MENGRSGSCASTHVAELIDFASAFVATMLLFDRSTQRNRVIVVYVRHVATSWPPNGDLSVTTHPLCKEVGEWNRVYTISNLALNWKTMLTFSCFPCNFVSFFFESFDRDDGMPLDVANIEISIVASISLCIPPLFRIYISTLCIFIYPSWKRTRIILSNYCKFLSSYSTQNY